MSNRRDRPRLAPLILAAALAATGASCGGDDEPSDGTTTSDPGATTSTSSVLATTSAPDATTTTLGAMASDLVLRGDGLGVVELGADPDSAVAAVTAALGEPSVDTGWEPSFSRYGTCPGTNIRGVEWGFLVLLFTDGETTYGSGEHLFSWRLTGAPPPVATAEGFGYQATADDAAELYPGGVELVPADEPFPAFLEIDIDGGTVIAYLDESERVTNIEAGVPCGE